MEVYQYANGAYLPASSQPSNTIDFEIKTKKYTPHESVRYMNVYVGSNGIAKRANSTGSLIDCEKNLPVLYEKRESCCGCTACFAICPVQAISMLPDEAHFFPDSDHHFPFLHGGTVPPLPQGSVLRHERLRPAWND